MDQGLDLCHQRFRRGEERVSKWGNESLEVQLEGGEDDSEGRIEVKVEVEVAFMCRMLSGGDGTE